MRTTFDLLTCLLFFFFLHKEATCTRRDVTRRLGPPDVGIPGLDLHPLSVPLESSSTALNITASTLNTSSLISYAPWPLQWPWRTHVVPRQLDPRYEDSPVRTIDMEFSKAGRDCVYRGQNLLVQPAFGKYVREWPETPPSPGSRYFLHGEEFTRYLKMSFAASDELQSHALHDYLWQLTARMIRWLERVYIRHGCKTSHVRATARWIDGEQIVLGDFALDVTEPPTYHQTQQWPPVSSFPYTARIPTFESSYPQTRLDFLDQATAEHRSYWDFGKRPGRPRDYIGTDVDPVRQQAMVKMFDDTITRLAMRGEVGPSKVIEFTALRFDAWQQHIFGRLICDDRVRGWKKNLLLNVLIALRNMIFTRGILRDVIDVYRDGIYMGHLSLRAP